MKNTQKWVNSMFKNTLIMLLAIAGINSAYAVDLVDVQFHALEDDKTRVSFKFDGAAPEVASYEIDQPARISIDLLNTKSVLDSKYFQVGENNLRSATIVGTKDRTRVVLNLDNMVPYEVVESGTNELIYLIGKKGDSFAGDNMFSIEESKAPIVELGNGSALEHIDFDRGENGEGRIIIKFSEPVNADVNRVGANIRISVKNTSIPVESRRRIDVVAFGTPVSYINASEKSGNAIIDIQPNGHFEHLSYQTNDTMVVEFKPISQDEADAIQKEKFPYNGEKITLNFQNIEVRQALQLLGAQANLNLVVSKNVTGAMVVELNDVPIDQALDVVLRVNGLAQRQVGNVMYIAPIDELAVFEKQELEARKQVAELAPLAIDYIQINYATAADIMAILSSGVGGSAEPTFDENGDEIEVADAVQGGNGFLTSRGSVAYDERTNKLIVKDTVENLENIRETVARFDIPVKQVSIEARIVVARTSLGKELGIQWGGAMSPVGIGSNNSLQIGGSTDANIDYRNQVTANTVAGTNDPITITYPESFLVDLPAPAGSQSVAFGFAALDYVLDLELQALETTGKAEVVSQPKLVTASGQTASIVSGTALPYRGEDGATVFRNAGLTLTVTPRVTPNNQMNMELVITQDSVGISTPTGMSIDTNSITTQVLVNNGDTLVLGGVFRNEVTEGQSKTPILGDLPVIGSLFRNSTKAEEKQELLIFITPKLVEDGIVLN